MNDKITIMQETFKNGKTNEDVPGITIIVDGKFRQVLDILNQKNNTGNGYVEIIQKALFTGLEQLMRN